VTVYKILPLRLIQRHLKHRLPDADPSEIETRKSFHCFEYIVTV